MAKLPAGVEFKGFDVLRQVRHAAVSHAQAIL